MNRTLKRGDRGFSLIELMVAVSLFAVIMLVAVGSLLALVNANRKARALEAVMNNLNIAIDGMARSLRMGSAYNCDSTAVPSPSGGGDCSNPGPEDGHLVSFAPFGSNANEQTERWVYSFEDGKIFRSRNGGEDSVPITAPEVIIEDVKFYVIGTPRANHTSPANTIQPRVVMVIKGTAGAEQVNTSSTFYIQATAVQRLLDL